jgi:hypothetical protein
MGSWFRKTTVFSYDSCIDELKQQVHALLDRNIQHAYESSLHGQYVFQINVPDSLPITRNSYVKDIPAEAYFDSVRRVVSPRPYILYPVGGEHGLWYTVCLVQIPVPQTRPVGVRLARAAILTAREANDNCAITLEPLRSVSACAVSHCGHVFSEVAADLPVCPLCKMPATWTVVSETPSSTSASEEK